MTDLKQLARKILAKQFDADWPGIAGAIRGGQPGFELELAAVEHALAWSQDQQSA